jgi:hypothetical protein
LPARAAELRFFVDESALGLGKTLERARRDVIHPGHPLIPTIPPGTLDPNWIPEVASRDLIVIARDRHIRTKPGERRLLVEYGLRVFWIAGKKDLSNWDVLVRMVRHWEAIERTIAENGAGPWFVGVNEHSLSEIPIY